MTERKRRKARTPSREESRIGELESEHWQELQIEN